MAFAASLALKARVVDAPLASTDVKEVMVTDLAAAADLPSPAAPARLARMPERRAVRLALAFRAAGVAPFMGMRGRPRVATTVGALLLLVAAAAAEKLSRGEAPKPEHSKPTGQGLQVPSVASRKVPQVHPTQALPCRVRGAGQVRGTQSAAVVGTAALLGCVPMGQEKAAPPVEIQVVEPVERVIKLVGQAWHTAAEVAEGVFEYVFRGQGTKVEDPAGQ